MVLFASCRLAEVVKITKYDFVVAYKFHKDKQANDDLLDDVYASKHLYTYKFPINSNRTPDSKPYFALYFPTFSLMSMWPAIALY